jgi:arabinofuranan 3-O-arabinosyltransferase
MNLRPRWFAASLVLVAIAFFQDPGRIAADTKLDLTVDPWGLMARGMSVWEPLAFFGHLPNQGYGYLFPLGPFFAVGEFLALPDWVVQRLWWSLLMVVAFLGVVRLARMLGVTGFWPRLFAGFAFALGPRMVTELGVLSVEVLPYAVAPWVLIPLVGAAQGRSLRRSAAASGLAVVCAGGVNAVATFAVVPLGAWWILTRFRGRRRWAMSGWWVLSLAAATVWWVIPLLLLGRYSPPFLDWIEPASVTTSITTPDTVLRGTSQWVAYIADGGGAVWPSGWALVTQPVAIMALGVLAAVGLAGMALRGTPYRTFLLGGVLIGWVMVSFGHVGAPAGIGSEAINALLDGALAPLRNTHKFEVVLRLPLALGIAFAVQAVLRRRSNRRRTVTDDHRERGAVAPAAMVGGVAMIALALIASIQPAWSGLMTKDRSFAEVPVYWHQAAQWLADRDTPGRALVLPSASFAVYSWGRTNDEPLQALAQTPWVVRDAVPLTQAGAIRWLDAINERVVTGRGSAGLAASLARGGVDYVVIRHDLDRRRSGAARGELVRQALIRSGGFSPAAAFGPTLPPYRTETTVIDDGLADTTTSVEIWQVNAPDGGADPRVTIRQLEEAIIVPSSSEAVADLMDAGALNPGTPVLTQESANAIGLSEGVTGISDAYRRTEVDFGRGWGNRSVTLTSAEDYAADRRIHDYVVPGVEYAQWRAGDGRVTASSSRADIAGLAAPRLGEGPWAALDADPGTAWKSAIGRDDSPWWQVEWEDAQRLGGPDPRNVLRIRLALDDFAEVTVLPVTATTDAGTVVTELSTDDEWQELAVPSGTTRSLRVSSDRGFGIAELDVPAVPRRVLNVPGVADGGPIVLTARRGEAPGCIAVLGTLSCSERLGEFGEERSGISRRITVSDTGEYRVRIMLRPRPGQALDDLLEPIGSDAITATASSQWVRDPAGRAQSAVDGSLETAWLASPGDRQPELTLTWQRPREVRGVRLAAAPALAASRPLSVTVIINGTEIPTVVSTDGVLRVPTQTATSLSLRFDNATSVRSLDPITGVTTTLPLGVSEVTVLGASDLAKGPLPGQLVAVPCGFGPSVVVDSRPVLTTRVSTTVGSVLTDGLAVATACGGRVITLGAGVHEIDVDSTAEFIVESVLLQPVVPWSGGAGGSRTAEPASGPIDPRIATWGVTERTVEVPPGLGVRILETTETANEGWTAEVAGSRLVPVVVDGWRQAWVIPERVSGLVSISFAPQSFYRAGLLAGLIAVLGLIVLAAWPSRGARRSAFADQPVTAVPTSTPEHEGGHLQRSLVLPTMAIVAGALVAGPLGLVIAGATAGSIWVTTRRWTALRFLRYLRPGIAFGAIAVSGVVAAVYPWPDRLGAPDSWQLLLTGLTVLGLAAAAAPTCDGESSV